MDKNTDISERILEMIDYLNVNANDFAKILGYNRSQAIYDMLNGKARPSFDFFNKLLNSEFSEIINIEYLISGNGTLLKTKSKDFATLYNGGKKGGKKGGKPNVKISSPFKEDPINGIPLIPIDAMAGFGVGDLSVMEYEVSRYVVPEFEELHVEFMIRVKGSSMQPKYSSGDLVACKRLILNDIFFQWNKVYVLDTEQGALIKRVKKGKDQSHILLVSDNAAYDPFELSIEKVRAIAIVLGVIRLE